MRVVYWNVGRRFLLREALTIAAETDADVICLAECFEETREAVEFPPNEITLSRRFGTPIFRRVISPSDGTLRRKVGFVELHVRDAPGRQPKHSWLIERTRYRFVELSFEDGTALTLGLVHYFSRVSRDREEQNELAGRLARDLSEAEAMVEHDRSMLIGDFNFEPFDTAMVSAEKLHAVPDHQDALRLQRTVAGESRAMMYNPMWRFFGDENGSPAGTYFHRNSETATPFWHVFDQVILRPSLLPAYAAEDPLVVTEAGGRPLLDSATGRPDRDRFSDHLPLTVRLELSRLPQETADVGDGIT